MAGLLLAALFPLRWLAHQLREDEDAPPRAASLHLPGDSG